MRPAPDSLALKWLCPGARATILPRFVSRNRFVYDLLVFMQMKLPYPAVGTVCPNGARNQVFLLSPARAGSFAGAALMTLGGAFLFAGSRSSATERPFGPFWISSAILKCSGMTARNLS